MDLFAITCTTCKSRLRVRDPAAVGQILACPKCGGSSNVDWIDLVKQNAAHTCRSCRHYWIDFAACHPTQEGRMVLAIECDGVSYHSSPTTLVSSRRAGRALDPQVIDEDVTTTRPTPARAAAATTRRVPSTFTSLSRSA